MTAVHDAAANSGTTAVREGHAFDVMALQQWMAEHVEGFAGPLHVEQFKGGQSNPTFLLTASVKRYVLRRKPPGEVLKGAHAVEREAQVMQALAKVDFPVPHIYALCTDDKVIGSWFYVMEMVEGRIFWDAKLPDVPAAERPHYFAAMNETIAKLHQVDVAAAGLSEYGKSGNYFARQIARWTRQYQEDTDAGRDVNMDMLVQWLPTRIPDGDESCLIHGDFRCDNMIFHPTEPKVLAVLDWELSTIGHPLGDFAFHAMMYRMPPDIVAGLLGVDLASQNLPTEAEYVAQYCRHTGRESIQDWEFYIAFNFFRLAAIFHGIKGRAMRGTASSAHAQERGNQFPRLAQLAADAMKACG